MNTVIKEGEVNTSTKRQQYPLPPSMSYLLSLGSILIKHSPSHFVAPVAEFVINFVALSSKKKKAVIILNNGITLF